MATTTTAPLATITPTADNMRATMLAANRAQDAYDALTDQDPDFLTARMTLDAARAHDYDTWKARAAAARATIPLENYTGPLRPLIAPLRAAMDDLVIQERTTAPEHMTGHEIIAWTPASGGAPIMRAFPLDSRPEDRPEGPTVARVDADGTVTLTA